MGLRVLLLLLGMTICINQTGYAKHTLHKKSRHHSVQTSSRTPTSYIMGSDQLAATLASLINSSNFKADIGVYVKSMQGGGTLYGRQVSQPLTPASTMKILTAESALIFLGPNYRFSTQMLTDAPTVKNGVLQGNLYIVLSGDPTLTYNDLLEMMDALRAEQIHAISGNVYIDNTAYDQRFYGPGWIWKDKGYCYAAPISASIINHNCLSYVAPRKKTKQQAKLKLKSANGSSYRRRSYVFHIPRSGLPYTSGVSSVVTDIPEYNRSLFKGGLNQIGVRVYGSVTFGSAPTNLSMIGSHSSEPLRNMVKIMLKKSDNVIAGALFKKLGQLYSQEPGSWENGSLAVSQILSHKAGVNIKGLRVLDGSGLSPDNLATPEQMMQVLDFAYHHPATSNDFMSALPIAGVDGTLKHRMGNIARRVRAKTGTISGVVSLAGYAESADKESLGFVIIINGYRGMGWRYKGLEDKIVTALTRYKSGVS